MSDGEDIDGLVFADFPPMPDLEGSRAREWSPQSLAFLGDSVWELYMRQKYFMPRSHVAAYHNKVRDAVKAEAQAAFVDQLLEEAFWSVDEQALLKWGRNAAIKGSALPKRLKQGKQNIYRQASALECLVRTHLALLFPVEI
eukprot:gene8514-10111_t